MAIEFVVNEEALQKFDQMLAAAQSLDQIKEVRDAAEVAKLFARQAGLGLHVQNQAAELKLRAERKVGQLLTASKLRGGNRKSKSGDLTLKISDHRITKNQSAEWQQAAAVSEDEFQKYIEQCKAAHKELSSAGLLRLARQLRAARGVVSKQSSQSPGQRNKLSPNDASCLCDEGSSTRTIMVSVSDIEACQHAVSELRHHRDQLQRLLSPVCNATTSQVKAVEQRQVKRLLLEMSQLLGEAAECLSSWRAEPTTEHFSEQHS